MKYYYLYLKTLLKNRKEIKSLIHSYVCSTGELIDHKQQKMIKQDFEGILNHKPQIKITEEDMKDFLKGKTIDITKIIKERS